MNSVLTVTNKQETNSGLNCPITAWRWGQGSILSLPIPTDGSPDKAFHNKTVSCGLLLLKVLTVVTFGTILTFEGWIAAGSKT